MKKVMYGLAQPARKCTGAKRIYKIEGHTIFRWNTYFGDRSDPYTETDYNLYMLVGRHVTLFIAYPEAESYKELTPNIIVSGILHWDEDKALYYLTATDQDTLTSRKVYTIDSVNCSYITQAFTIEWEGSDPITRNCYKPKRKKKVKLKKPSVERAITLEL